MTSSEKIAYKNLLKQHAHTIMDERIAASKLLMDAAQEAANSEEKSSVGDKYETGRAMGQLAKDMYARQLSEHMNELSQLLSIDTGTIRNTVQAGTVVHADDAIFFMSIGLGKLRVEGKTVIFLSPLAPLSKLIWNKKEGDEFLFNNKTTKITHLY